MPVLIAVRGDLLVTVDLSFSLIRPSFYIKALKKKKKKNKKKMHQQQQLIGYSGAVTLLCVCAAFFFYCSCERERERGTTVTIVLYRLRENQYPPPRVNRSKRRRRRRGTKKKNPSHSSDYTTRPSSSLLHVCTRFVFGHLPAATLLRLDNTQTDTHDSIVAQHGTLCTGRL